MDRATRLAGTQAALRGIIAEAGAAGPALIVVEDIHWADPATVDVLATMAEAVVAVPILLVLTTRPEGNPLDATWRARCAATPLATIDLSPLRPEDARQLALAFFEASPALTEQCVRRAEGNPLFLEQLLRNTGEGAEATMPSSIHSIVLARLDRLPPRDRRALQAAAVIGQRVELACIRHVMDDALYDWAPLIASALLRPDGPAGLFAHALVREGVYAALLKARRRALHQRAAAWFTGQDEALRARHLERAEDPQAAAAFLAAATAEQAAYRFDRALELAERGLPLADGEPVTRHALLCLIAVLQADLGTIAPAIATWRVALDAAPDALARCRTLLGLAGALRILELLPEALERLAEAETIATAHDSTLDLARLHHVRGNIYFPLGRTTDCRRAHETSLAYARRSGVAEAEALALGGIGDATYMQGHMASAHRAFTECADVARREGFGRIEVANRPMLAHTLNFLGRFREARVVAGETGRLAASIGHHRGEMVAAFAGYYAAHDLGDLDDGETLLADTEGLVERFGGYRFRSQHLNFTGRFLLARNDRAAGIAALRRALAVSREHGMYFCGPMIVTALAAAVEDQAESADLLAEGAATLASGAVGHNYLWFYRDVIDIMLARGDATQVRQNADALTAYTASEPLPWSHLFATRGRLLADHLDGHDVAGPLAAIRDEFAAAGLAPYLSRLDAALNG